MNDLTLAQQLADIASSAKQNPQMRASPTGLWFPGDIKLSDLNKDGLINVGEDKAVGFCA